MFGAVTAVSLILAQLLAAVAPGPAAPPAPPVRDHAVCSAPSATDAGCVARVWGRSSDGRVTPAATPKALLSGYGPTQFRSAYGVGTASATVNVAVITAYDDPNVAADLATYSQAMNLPAAPACATAAQTGCLAKLSQTGTTVYPQPNRSWSLETSLDTQTVHGLCPTCRLTLIEAKSASYNDLLAAIDQAVAQGAQVVSMSWGGSEGSAELGYDSHFAPAGVTFVAASGDSGYATSWPAASGRVIAAGGTHLTLTSTGARASETVWNGTGSGCSRYEPKPVWQHDTGCAKRTIADVAADADPATGAAIYSSYSSYSPGWFIVGGTSLATPIISSLVALAGGPTTQTGVFTKLYGSLGGSSLFDVLSGSNARRCTPAYLCTAGTGYDGPTGVGAPVGLGAL